MKKQEAYPLRQQLQQQHLRLLLQAAPKAAAPAAGAGSVKVTASVPGKVVKVAASVGQAVKAGDSVVILESMKMEIPVVAPQDGTIASIDVAEGASVENGDTLATMN